MGEPSKQKVSRSSARTTLVGLMTSGKKRVMETPKARAME